MAITNKITTGWVTQTFDGDRCIRQEFCAGDEVDWEDDKGNVIDPIETAEYQTFDMVQPSGQDKQSVDPTV